MDLEKTVARYRRAYRKALASGRFDDIDLKAKAYELRLRQMLASENFRRHSVYPSTDTTHIYGVIAMCLELKEFGLSDGEIIETVNRGFAARRNFFRRLIRCINLLPNSFSIAKKWNISDHDKRVRDGSLTYDYFIVGEDKLEYRITRCVYVEIFENYGIRSLCKIFCMTDTTAYGNLPRHVKFIRHSDLSDGDCCWDEVIRRESKDT